jgi:RNase P/RNase MRP subunit p30
LRILNILSYFETRLPVNFDDLDDVYERLKFCKKLGIKSVILESKSNLNIIPLEVKKKIEQKIQLDTYFRINLRPINVEKLKKQLKKYNKFSDILSIESFNKNVQLYAAKDSRVDILSFSDKNIIKTITPGVISLTKQNNSYIEFSLAPIMEDNKAQQSKNFRNLYRFIHLAKNLKANYIISGNFNEIFELRHPRALISICHTLLGLPLDLAKKIFSINPKELLLKIQERLNANLISGVRVVKGGD